MSDQDRRIRINDLIDGRHHAESHELLEDLACFNAHSFREVGNRNGSFHANDSLDGFGGRQFGLLEFFSSKNFFCWLVVENFEKLVFS